MLKWTLNFPSLCLLIPVLSYTHYFEVRINALVKLPDGTSKSYDSYSSGKAAYTLAGNLYGGKSKALSELEEGVDKRAVNELIRQIVNDPVLQQPASSDNKNE